MHSSDLICLVIRKGRQWPFARFSALCDFTERHPYRNETLLVIPVIDSKPYDRAVLPADQVPDFVAAAYRHAGRDAL